MGYFVILILIVIVCYAITSPRQQERRGQQPSSDIPERCREAPDDESPDADSNSPSIAQGDT